MSQPATGQINWRRRMACSIRTRLYGQSVPYPSCGAEMWRACRSVPSTDAGRS